ncbi:MAG: glycosyltransferase family 4 protein [Bryobacterales bacterium]|nr:glycosyltransferase family 4 protein [Bryobacterales bacterium]
MKICFLCSEYPPGRHGGIGSVTRVLGRALASAGHQVRVIGCYPESLPERDNDHGVEIYRMPLGAGRFSWLTARRDLFRQISRWARNGEIDVVEVPDWEGGAAGWSSLPVPVVSRLHGSLTYFCSEMSQPADRLTSWLERRSWRRSDFSCSTSNYTARRTTQLMGSHRSGVEVLYNPVEIDSIPRQQQRDTHRVVYAGTLTAKKGIVQLIKAWPIVAAAHPKAELHVYGKDQRPSAGASMQEWLTSLLPGSAVASVSFHGHVPREDVQSALRSCALAVFPSYSEAFALAPMEAMAEGCPVVYTTRASGPELITDGADGLLVDPDDVPGIARVILRLLHDREFAARTGAAGRLRVASSFSTDVLVPRNEYFYQSCIDRFKTTCHQHLQG